MAVVFTELFEGGADGVALTTANTNFTDFNGSGSAEFDTDLSVEGNSSGLFLEPRQAHGLVPSGGEFYISEYVYFHVESIGNFDFNLALDSDSIQARCQIAADGRFRLLDGGSVVTATTHVMIPDQWYRIEWTIDEASGTQDLLIFTGANLNSLTPTESHTGATYSGSATIDEFTYGRVSGAAIDMNFDRIILDDAAMPAPISEGVSIEGTAGVALPTGQGAALTAAHLLDGQPAAASLVGAVASLDFAAAVSVEGIAGAALPIGQAAALDGTVSVPSITRCIQPFAAPRPIRATAALRPTKPTWQPDCV